MLSKHGNSLVATLIGVLALTGTAGRAAAQAGDTGAASQGQQQQAQPNGQSTSAQAPTPPDTAGYAKFKREMGKAGDTLKPPTGATVNYRKHKVYRSKSDTGGVGATPEQAATPPYDTSGYAKFKREMGKAGDTLKPPAGKTVRYRHERTRKDTSSRQDSSGAAKDTTGAK